MLRTAAATVAVLMLAATACGGDDEGSSPPAGSGTKVAVTMTDFHFDLSEQKFSPGVYTFSAKNNGQANHAFEIEGPGGEKKTDSVSPGGSADVTIELKAGEYEIYCPVDGHKDKGMTTKITVG